jgi:hypothetical protein
LVSTRRIAAILPERDGQVKPVHGALDGRRGTGHGLAMVEAARVPVSLVSVRTRDGVILAGLAVEPRGRRRTALVWVHGLGSTFSSGQPLIRALSTRLAPAGVGYLKLDNRATTPSRATARASRAPPSSASARAWGTSGR